MGVYIPNWDKPKSCDECWAEYAYEICNSHSGACPLVPVPPHGRLIDADALIDDVRRNSESYFADDFAHEWVDKAPTIIPAEEADNE